MQNDRLQLKAQQIYQIGFRGEGKGEIQTFKDLAPIQTSNQQDIRKSLAEPVKITSTVWAELLSNYTPA